MQILELLGIVTKLSEQVSQCFKKLGILIRLNSSIINLSLEFCKWICVSAFASL
jgi:hypothetical protein